MLLFDTTRGVDIANRMMSTWACPVCTDSFNFFVEVRSVSFPVK